MLIIDKDMLANNHVYILSSWFWLFYICKNRILVKENVF